MQSFSRGAAALRRTATLRSTTPRSLNRARFNQRRWMSDPAQNPHHQPPPPEFGEPEPRRGGSAALKMLAVFGLTAGGVYYFYPFSSEPASETTPKSDKPKKVIPAPEKKPIATIPLKSSTETPGVYAWGSNAGRVIDPESNESTIKAPQRIPYFDDQVLRDLKLRHNFGAAINEKGDLVMWGAVVSPTSPGPVPTLEGKDLVKLAISADRVIALSSKGMVYSVPVSRHDQQTGVKISSQGSWLPFWSSSGAPDAVNYRILTPGSLARGEKITDIKAGLEHCLMLTSKGRVFSAAASTAEYPTRGQLGIPRLTWATRPEGPYDQPHELKTVSETSKITQIAAGDLHSVLLDAEGRVLVFGDNTFGQLGFGTAQSHQVVDKPTALAVDKLYVKTEYVPRVTSIETGGMATFFTVDATKAVTDGAYQPAKDGKELPSEVCDVWACGSGLYGTLGTGKFTHASARPAKLKALSSVFEFDEATNKLAPIRISHLSVGATHACAVMAAKADTPAHAGSDVLVWGGNEHFQLGTGKRTNLNAPAFIAGLDAASRSAEEEGAGSAQRLQLAPRRTYRMEGGKGRKVVAEQRVECGGYVTAVYYGV